MGYLDQVRNLEAIKECIEQSISLLNLKPGYNVLDVGCGTGEDVISMGEIVGAEGRATGIDISQTMISEAQKRVAEQHLTNVEFAVKNAESLDLADESFEGCRADRVLQHLKDPDKAMGEIIRVAKKEGRIVVVDTDWDSIIVDSAFKDLTRRVIHAGTDGITNGWRGRQSYGMFKALALENVEVRPFTGVLTDYALASHILNLDSDANLAEGTGLIKAKEKTRWISDLQKKQALGRFFASVTVFLVAATKR